MSRMKDKWESERERGREKVSKREEEEGER